MKSLCITTEVLGELRRWLEGQNEVFEFFKDLERSSLLISHLIRLELAGPNNNLARHLRYKTNNEVVDQSLLSADVIRFKGAHGVRISWPNTIQIKVSYPALSEIVDLYENSIVIVPAKIAQLIKKEGIEPVIVKPWLIGTLFNGFDPATMKYRDQMWELENNDVMLYAQLVENKQMVFQGIHDVVEHTKDGILLLE